MANNTRQHRIGAWTGLWILGFAAVSLAAPVKQVALIDRSLWPDPVSTRPEFDRASRAENLLFVNALLALQEQSQDFPTLLDVKSVNQTSIAQWLDKTLDLIVRNIHEAKKSCIDENDLGCKPKTVSRSNLKAYAAAFVDTLPSRYREWAKNASTFYRTYGIEQLRLAALFPAITSEILTFSKQESAGLEWNDLDFLLTFDDGPTPAGGITDRVSAQLAKQNLHGLFFVLRDEFQKRVENTSPKDVQALYQGQCVGIHGGEHKPHPKMKNWKESIDSSLAAVQPLIKENSAHMFFRPPFGQRNEEILAYLTERHVSVLLWNIDSQDWHSQVPKERMADRVLTLMLLWRRGIVLFHDTHDKVLTTLPDLIQRTKSLGIHWQDCRTL